MKQRIVGALVLVALAAIIVPIMMDFRNDDLARQKSLGIPPKDFTVQVLPLVHPDKTAAELPSNATQAAFSPPGQAPAGGDVFDTASGPDATAATVPGGGDDSPKAWAVQVGSFSTERLATALRDRLRARHFDAYVEKIALASGKSGYRVRVGPELLRSDAEKLQRELQQELKLSGIVVSH